MIDSQRCFLTFQTIFKPFYWVKTVFFRIFRWKSNNSIKEILNEKKFFRLFFQNFFDENLFFEEMIWLNHNDIFWHFKLFSTYFIRLKRYFFGYSVRKSKKSIFLNTFFHKQFEFYKLTFPPYKWEKVLFSVIFPSKINHFHRLKIKIYF